MWPFKGFKKDRHLLWRPQVTSRTKVRVRNPGRSSHPTQELTGKAGWERDDNHR